MATDSTDAPVVADTTPAAPVVADTTTDKSVDELAMEDITLDDDTPAPAKTEDSDSTDEGLDDGTPADDKADGAADDEDAADDGTDQKTDDSDDDQKTRGEERKDELNTEIRDLVSRRNDLRKQVAATNEAVYGVSTVEELINEINPDTGENYTPVEAEIKSMKDAGQLRDYNDQVAEAQLVINTEAQNVIKDFPMFNESDPGYNKQIAEGADELFALNLIRDPNTEHTDDKGNKIPGTGQIIGTHLPIYKLYKLIADASQVAAADGQIKGQKTVKKMMAQADTLPGAGPKTPADPGIDAFDKESEKYEK